MPPEKLRRCIELLSRYWVDNDMAVSDLQETRLATHKAYLVNELGLRMYEEDRVKEGLRPLKILHLPVQDRAVVAQAIGKLSEMEIREGIGKALQSLVDRHPFQGGGIPQKPGWTRAEAKVIGIRAESRDGDGRALWELVLEVISERWLSSHEWAVMKNSARLASDIEVLVSKGYEVSVEHRVNPSTGRKFAAYRYFKDPGERAAWKQEQAEREFMRNEELRRKADQRALDESERARKRIEARVEKRRQSLTQQQTRYGGWKTPAQPAAMPKMERAFFTAPAPAPAPAPAQLVPKAPPPDVRGRLASLGAREVLPKVEIASAPGVPVEQLNRAYPSAASRQEVQFQGRTYRRRFKPHEENGRRVAWHVFWEVVPSEPAAS